MSIGEIYLGLSGYENLLSAYDRTFSQKRLEISREERTADGTLVIDYIAVKYIFTLAYETMDNQLLDLFESLYFQRTTLSLIVYYSETGSSTYSVRMKPFDQTRLLLSGSETDQAIWSGVTIELEEI